MEGTSHHGGEYCTEERRSENAALFHAVHHWKGFWMVSSSCNHETIGRSLWSRSDSQTSQLSFQAVSALVNEGPKEVAVGFFPGAGVQQISCRQIHVLSGNHTGFLEGNTEQDVGWGGWAGCGSRSCQQSKGEKYLGDYHKTGDCLSFGLCWHLLAVVGPFLYST